MLRYFPDLRLWWCEEHPDVFYAPYPDSPQRLRVFPRSAPGGDELALSVYDRLCRGLKPKKRPLDAEAIKEFRRLLFPDGFPFEVEPFPSIGLVQGSLLGGEVGFKRRKEKGPLADWRAEAQAALEAKYEKGWAIAQADRARARASSAASAEKDAPEIKPTRSPVPVDDGVDFQAFLECGCDAYGYRGKEKLNKYNELSYLFPSDPYFQGMVDLDRRLAGQGPLKRVRRKTGARPPEAGAAPLANVMSLCTKAPNPGPEGDFGHGCIAFGAGREGCRWGMKARRDSRVSEARSTIQVFTEYAAYKKAEIDSRYRLADWIKQGLKYNGKAYRRIGDDCRVEWEGFNSFMACCEREIPDYSHDGRYIHTKKGQKIEWKDKTKYWATTMPGFIGLYDHYDKEGNYKCSHLGGLVRCGNAFFCPICGMQVRAIKRNQILQVSDYESEKKAVPVTVRFSTTHGKMTHPVDCLHLLSRCMKKMRRGGWYTRFLKKYGAYDWVYELECTVDDPRTSRETGVNWHYHFIFWLDFKGEDMTEEQMYEFEKDLKERWCYVLTRDKKFAEVCQVKDVEKKKPSILQNGTHVDFVTHGLATGENKAVDEYLGDALAFELSPNLFSKQGNEDGRMSAFQYIALAAQRLAVHKDNSLFPYAILLMEAMKGQHSIQFARGLKARAGVVDEKTTPEKKKDERERLVAAFWVPKKDRANSGNAPEFFYIRRFYAHRRFVEAYEERRRAGVAPQKAFFEVFDAFKAGHDPRTGEDIWAATYGQCASSVPIYRGGKGVKTTKTERARARYQRAA